jgi:hypothetical protein
MRHHIQSSGGSIVSEKQVEAPLAWITWDSSETRVFHFKAYFDAVHTLCCRDGVRYNRTIYDAYFRGWRLCRNCERVAKRMKWAYPEKEKD